MCTVLYDFFRDQGSIIAGILALIAGVIAYKGAMRAAVVQVHAVNTQTEILRQQNAELKNENTRKLAREGIIAIRLLAGVLRRVKDDTGKLRQLLEQPNYAVPNAAAPADWRKLVYKPPLAVVWNNLGACGSETVDKYLLLDAMIDEFAQREINGAEYIKKRLAEFEKLVDVLNDELDRDAKRCTAALAESTIRSEDAARDEGNHVR